MDELRARINEVVGQLRSLDNQRIGYVGLASDARGATFMFQSDRGMHQQVVPSDVLMTQDPRRLAQGIHRHVEYERAWRERVGDSPAGPPIVGVDERDGRWVGTVRVRTRHGTETLVTEEVDTATQAWEAAFARALEQQWPAD